MMAQKTEPKPLGLVWINCPHPVVAQGLAKILETEAQIHCGQKPPARMAPSSVIFCSDRAEDPAQEVRHLQALVPNVPIVVFCFQLDLPLVRAALQAGARGFTHADMQPAQIIRTLSFVSAGEIVVPNEVLEDLVGGEARPTPAILSPRQREILKLVAEGLTNAQIGQRLSLSEITIKQHLRAAYKLLGVRNRVGAVMLLKESG